MQEAIRYGLANETVVALIVREGTVVVKRGGSIFSKPDATGHSEMEALRATCEQLGTHDLSGCWLYSTFEPCPMCMSAATWANLDGVVYGATREDRNETWRWQPMIPASEVAERSPVDIEVFGSVC